MSLPTIEKIQQDKLALAAAEALAVANKAASDAGISVQDARLTIGEEAGPPHRLWRVHYRLRDRRGGDLIVIVDEATGSVQRTMRGR